MSSPCSSNHLIATEPLHTHSIPTFIQPLHRYRTFAFILQLHVSPTIPSLQNLCIHSPSLCFSNHAIATEPYINRSTSMFLQPFHRYRTLGNIIVTTSPWGFTFRMSIRPCIKVTARRTIAKPSPLPLSVLLRALSVR